MWAAKVGATLGTRVFASKVIKAGSAFVAASTRTTEDVLSHANALTHARIAGDAYSETAFTCALARVRVSTGLFKTLVFIV